MFKLKQFIFGEYCDILDILLKMSKNCPLFLQKRKELSFIYWELLRHTHKVRCTTLPL